jgi:hypothetical protein
VHPRGAPPPDRSVAADRRREAVYGDAEVERSYGERVGIARRSGADHRGRHGAGFRRPPLRFLDTPGHARHHHAVWDERSRSVVHRRHLRAVVPRVRHRAGPWLLPTTTPVQFEPEALAGSVRRVLALAPRFVCLTHYGPLGDVPRSACRCSSSSTRLVALGQAVAGAPDRHDALRRGLAALYLARLRQRGSTMDESRALELLGMDIELNAQGMGIWLDRREALNEEIAWGASISNCRAASRSSPAPARASAPPAPSGSCATARRSRCGTSTIHAAARSRSSSRRGGARTLYVHCNVASKAEVDAALRRRWPPSAASTRWSTTPASSGPPTSSTSPRPTGTR